MLTTSLSLNSKLKWDKDCQQAPIRCTPLNRIKQVCESQEVQGTRSKNSTAQIKEETECQQSTMDSKSKRLVTNILADLRPFLECPNSSLRLCANRWTSQTVGFLAFPSACGSGSSRRCPDTGCFLWLRVLKKDISESALALVRYLLPPWLLASDRWRRQESTGMATNEERIQSSQGGFDALLALAPNWALHRWITLKHQRLWNRQNSGLWV